MIKISKKSWHFRMAKLGSAYGYHPSYGLCKYIREFAIGLLLFCLCTLVASVLLLGNMFAIIALFQGIWTFEAFFGIISSTTVMVVVVIGGAISLNTLSQYVKEHYPNDKDKKQSIVGLYVKTIKDKICPVIDDFVD